MVVEHTFGELFYYLKSTFMDTKNFLSTLEFPSVQGAMLKRRLILLGGASKNSNETWLGELEAALRDSYDTYIHRYSHWRNENNGVNRIGEALQLSSYILEHLGEKEPYFIIAKSIGISVALSASYSSYRFPKACVFAGTPFKGTTLSDEIEEYNTENLIRGYTIPITFVQNTTEPPRFIGPADLDKVLKELKVKNYTIIHGNGQGHAYLVEQLRDETLKLIK